MTYYHLSPTPNIKKLVPYSSRHKSLDAFLERWKNQEPLGTNIFQARAHTKRNFFFDSLKAAVNSAPAFKCPKLYVYEHVAKRELKRFEWFPCTTYPTPVEQIGEIEVTRRGDGWECTLRTKERVDVKRTPGENTEIVLL